MGKQEHVEHARIPFMSILIMACHSVACHGCIKIYSTINAMSDAKNYNQCVHTLTLVKHVNLKANHERAKKVYLFHFIRV
ncbi:hypothetical protein DDM57_02705 [Vibrio cholerae]|nr:hypothetical protein [Vibrio cholerae]EGR4134209.1 hypothetical protein [Vibrio cholerae]EGR4257675.1 hypothetical protein [Vibrio cholerae]